MNLNLNQIARKWQKRWKESKIFEAKENSKKRKAYILEMYAYPSSMGLHMGHARNYTITDVYARFKRMQGYNVLYPVGYDSFGLPAENAAIKAKSHPKIFTEKAINNFIKQQKSLGLSYDWSRLIYSHNEEYYKWDQWIFSKLYEKGLAYKKKALVNWCKECNTVLANEQVVHGKCWRHKETDVEIKELEQWFFGITKYADRLLKGLDKLKDWPEDVKDMQRNWIGKSEGSLVEFKIKDNNSKIAIFTTRVDTLYGVTFVTFAPEHPLVRDLVKNTKYEKEVNEFIKNALLENKENRSKDKKGMFIGRYAINPVTNEEIPIYIANFVLANYGTGAVMAVPAHDQRDYEFAKKYNIEVKQVIEGKLENKAYEGDGKLVNSGQFTGMKNRAAITKINEFLKSKKLGGKSFEYRLRDWLVSRQRYWGCPIPIIYCDKCGMQLVKDLPVKLPENVKFGGKGNPLENVKEFVNVKCPKCDGNARRETDTMDTFIDSSWYFLRYCDAKNKKKIFDKDKVDYWMPIDFYIGGREHATGHLIYFRFITKFLNDLGLISVEEPALRLFNQGMLHKDGKVMSKSLGNVVLPEVIGEKYGIDSARLFLCMVASPEKDMEWSDKGIEGTYRFVNKLGSLYFDNVKSKSGKYDDKIVSKLHSKIKGISENIESLKYNIAIIDLMDLTNHIYKNRENISEKVYNNILEDLALLMSPFMPHLAEECWEKLGKNGFISLANWPSFDSKKINNEIEFEEDFMSGILSDVNSVIKLTNIKLREITIFISEKWKYDLFSKVKKELNNTRNVGEIIKKVMNKEHRKEISKLVPGLLKDESKIPRIILTQNKEFKIVSDNKEFLEKEFSCKVNIVNAEESNEGKAKNAYPGKVAILLE